MVQRREVVMEWMDGGVWRCWWTEGTVKVEARWSGGAAGWMGRGGAPPRRPGRGGGQRRRRDEGERDVRSEARSKIEAALGILFPFS